MLVSISILTLNITSCSSDSDIKQVEEKTYNRKVLKLDGIDVFIKEHIDLTTELSTLLDNEKDIKIEDGFEEKILAIKDNEEMKELLSSYGFSKPDLIIDVNNRVLENVGNLYEKNLFLFDIPVKEAESLILEKIDSNYELYIPNPENEYPIEIKRTCYEQYKIDIFRCKRNQSLGLAAAAITGLFSSGLGAIGGAIVSSVNYRFCMDDAISDSAACKDGK